MTNIDTSQMESIIARLEDDARDAESQIAFAKVAAMEAQDQARNAIARAADAESALERMHSTLKTSMDFINEMRNLVSRMKQE